ncbi:MAG: hypothetical protein LUF33_01760 [Clostridiales bacterium]|nr:hypothetical protein [Clostridiales bacterium]MCD8025679.1 hypothetical protein [Clostridiales bacterium]
MSIILAALDAGNNLLFVRQFRYPYKKVVLELSAGKREKGATPPENGDNYCAVMRNPDALI